MGIIEVVVATLILSVGLTALTGLSVHFSRQTRMAWERTETAIARQNTQERMWAMPFDSLESGGKVSDTHVVRWTVTDESPQVKLIRVREQIIPPCEREDEEEAKELKTLCNNTIKDPTMDVVSKSAYNDMGFQVDTFTVRRLKR